MIEFLQRDLFFRRRHRCGADDDRNASGLQQKSVSRLAAVPGDYELYIYENRRLKLAF
jgi:hypothetical protein